MSNEKNLVIKILQGLYEYLLFFPIFLMIGINFIAEEKLVIWLALLPILFVIGLIYRLNFTEQKWWVYSILSFGLGLIPSFVFGEIWWITSMLIIIHTAIIFRGIMYIGRTWDNLLPISFMWVGGFGIYFFGSIIFYTMDKLTRYFPHVTIGGAIIVVTTLFVSNNWHLRASTLSKDKKPFISNAIKVQNIFFISVTIIIIAFITYGNVIQDALIGTIRTIVSFLIGKQENPEIDPLPPPPSQSTTDLPIDDVPEPSFLAVLLETIFIYISYIIIFLSLIILILFTIKKTREMILKGIQTTINFLKQIVKRFTRNEKVIYVDEKESLFDFQDWMKERQENFRGFVQSAFKRKPNWNSLSNKEKVRFVYREFIQRELKDDIILSQTPRETLDKIIFSALTDPNLVEKLKVVYEETRYGEQNIDDEQIKEIYTLIQKSE